MCGICGIVDLKGARAVPPSAIRRMARRLAHRGPDGEGFHEAPGVALGHRRLAVIDVAGSPQPFRSADGSSVLVYNGEIYNHVEIRAELERRGRHFRTRGDTEVVLQSWLEWGEAALDRLRGMFAFAIWDETRRETFFARDRLGEKPLYWTVQDGFLIFASELAAVLPAIRSTPAVDPLALENYLAYGYVPDPRSIYAGIEKLAPGHLLRAKPGAPPRPERWWDLRFRPVRLGHAAEELVALLDDAVKMRMMSDVPLGAFLSGGLDSSAVVTSMAVASKTPVRTCSMAFADPRFDESEAAAAVARHCASDHHSEQVDPDALTLIDQLAEAYSEPFADSSAAPTWLVSRLARRRVTVALSGDGGDEVFAGYRRYGLHLREERVKALAPAALRRAVFGPVARAYPQLRRAPSWLRLQATFEALAGDSADGHFRAVAFMTDDVRGAVLHPDLRAALRGYHPSELLRGFHLRAGAHVDPVARMQYADLMTWLPGMMLVKVDRASMAHGLEVRPPLLDHVLVEWAAGLPISLRLDRRGGKAALRRAAAPRLPPGIAERRKQGFSVPLSDWLRGPLAGRVQALALPDGPLARSGAVDPRAIARLAAEHLSGRRERARALWSLLMLDAFFRGAVASRG